MAKALFYYSRVLSNRNATGRIIRYRIKSGYKQRKPYDTPTPYVSLDSVFTFTGDEENISTGFDAAVNLHEEDSEMFAPTVVAANNRAYERMISRLGDATSWGATSTAERKDTFGMLCSFLETILKAANHARRGNLMGVASVLKVPYEEKTVVTVRRRKRKTYRFRRRVIVYPDGRTLAKTAGSAWLLWSYGVSPLMSDIYSTVEILQSPLPTRTIRGGAKVSKNALYSDGTPGSYFSSNRYDFTASVRCAVDVAVTNPDIWLANRLGLVNPVQWINEAIPFSFVVDWFSNLSSIIGSLTDFYGLRLTNRRTTSMIDTSWTSVRGYPPDERRDISFKRKYTRFRRVLSIPEPKLQFAYERFSVQRGLNALSLLLGILPRSQPK
ncbi:maturation protein [ssRNA phage SRR7976325_21]|uniref:Maturation protein n=1 Tax=ssRNA phage SRR7976325_21 TaxID=2786709 RepID=A0A8S5L5J3_9VIRU|nr:maturation protein [ssRNA phage SRR7976325_21]DAD52780.1 TPA_asm: maturation protein [ssRNA phage SRR7976325_21]